MIPAETGRRGKSVGWILQRVACFELRFGDEQKQRPAGDPRRPLDDPSITAQYEDGVVTTTTSDPPQPVQTSDGVHGGGINVAAQLV